MRKKIERKEIKSDVANWENVIGHRPISKDVEIWKGEVKFFNDLFFQFYIACPEEKFRPILEYICKELGTNPGTVINVAVTPEKQDISDKLLELQDSIKVQQEAWVVIVAREFEKLIQPLHEHLKAHPEHATFYPLQRAGHDYNQNVAISERLKTAFGSLGKKIIVITHIGKSAGEEVYEKSVETALISQFRRGMIEVG